MNTQYTRGMGRHFAAAWRDYSAARARGDEPSQDEIFHLVTAWNKALARRSKMLAGLSARNAYWTHRELGLALRLRSDKDGQRAALLGCGGMTEEEVRALGVWELGQRRQRRLEAIGGDALGEDGDARAAWEAWYKANVKHYDQVDDIEGALGREEG